MSEIIPAETSAAEKYKDRKVILEIGGRIPGLAKDTSLLHQLAFPATSNPIYIGLNKELDPAEKHAAREGVEVELRTGDLSDPAFLAPSDLDGKVDRLYMFNVLGDPHTFGEMDLWHYKKLEKKILQLLKPGGKAFIGEWLTPQTVQWLKDWPSGEGVRKKLYYAEQIPGILIQEGISSAKVAETRDFVNAEDASKGGGHASFLVEYSHAPKVA